MSKSIHKISINAVACLLLVFNGSSVFASGSIQDNQITVRPIVMVEGEKGESAKADVNRAIAKRAKAGGTKVTQNKNANATPASGETSEAEASFEVFQKNWMRLLSQNGFYGPQHAKVKRDKGVYVARYRELGEPMSSEVKQTSDKKSPYVGIFSYQEKVYASTGNTEEEASRGNFRFEKAVKITEIFRFTDGKWIY